MIGKDATDSIFEGITRTPAPLPEGVQCYSIAATTGQKIKQAR